MGRTDILRTILSIDFSEPFMVHEATPPSSVSNSELHVGGGAVNTFYTISNKHFNNKHFTFGEIGH